MYSKELKPKQENSPLLSEAKIIQLISAISKSDIEKFLPEAESAKTLSLLEGKKICPPTLERQFSKTEIRELQPLILKTLEGYVASLISINEVKSVVCAYMEEARLLQESIKKDAQHQEDLLKKAVLTREAELSQYLQANKNRK